MRYRLKFTCFFIAVMATACQQRSRSSSQTMTTSNVIAANQTLSFLSQPQLEKLVNIGLGSPLNSISYKPLTPQDAKVEPLKDERFRAIRQITAFVPGKQPKPIADVLLSEQAFRDAPGTQGVNTRVFKNAQPIRKIQNCVDAPVPMTTASARYENPANGSQGLNISTLAGPQQTDLLLLGIDVAVEKNGVINYQVWNLCPLQTRPTIFRTITAVQAGNINVAVSFYPVTKNDAMIGYIMNGQVSVIFDFSVEVRAKLSVVAETAENILPVFEQTIRMIMKGAEL